MPTSHVVIAKRFPDELVRAALPDAEVSQGPDDREWSRDELLSRLADADALISWAFNRIDAELLAAAPRLKVVGFLAIGTDNFDDEAMRRAGVWGTHVPGAFAGAVAEVAMGLMLMVCRRLAEAERFVRGGQWQAPCPGRFDGPCLEGKQLGLLGCGAIGRRVAAAAGGLGMAVVYHDHTRLAPAEEERLQVRYRGFETLLADSDVLSLHVPLTPATHHLLDAAAFAQMKPGAVLINTSRGPVVDEAALVTALATGRLAGAGLDVFAHEPQVPAALLQHENVVVLPHMAGGSVESRRTAMATVLEDVRRVLAGDEPHHVAVRP